MPAIVKFSDFVLDHGRFELRRGERTLKLEKLPMELLFLLVERRGELVSRDEIVGRLWGANVFLEADRRHQYRGQQASSGTAGRRRSSPLQSNRGRQRISVHRVPHLDAMLPSARGSSVQTPSQRRTRRVFGARNGRRSNHQLSRSGSAHRAPTSAIRKYAGGDYDSLAAGRDLQVDVVLEGNVQHLDSRLRVSIQLIPDHDGPASGPTVTTPPSPTFFRFRTRSRNTLWTHWRCSSRA